jgi:hypothetical protein
VRNQHIYATRRCPPCLTGCITISSLAPSSSLRSPLSIHQAAVLILESPRWINNTRKRAARMGVEREEWMRLRLLLVKTCDKELSIEEMISIYGGGRWMKNARLGMAPPILVSQCHISQSGSRLFFTRRLRDARTIKVSFAGNIYIMHKCPRPITFPLARPLS